MASQDLVSEITPAIALASASIASSTTTNGNSVDMQGAESLAFVFFSGAYTDGTYTPQIEESSDNSTWSAVADADLIGTEASAAITAANEVFDIGYVGNERYVRLAVVSTSVTTGATIGATAVKGHLRVSDTPA